MISEEGPALAVGDVDGDGDDDLFFGGARRHPGAIYLQDSAGRFAALDTRASLGEDAAFEDVDALFVDGDRDGDLDLFVLSGGGEFDDDHDDHQPRLYVNGGAGELRRDRAAIPEHVRLVGGRVLAHDLDGDDSAELIVLPRARARRFAAEARGFVLAWRAGRYADVTGELAPWFSRLDMITDAVVVDDVSGAHLVLARDFGPVTAHAIGRDGAIAEEPLPIAPPGLWSAVAYFPAADSPGGVLWLGNLGHNSKFAARGDSLLRLYYGDWDADGSPEQLVTTTAYGDEQLVATRDELVQQITSLRKAFPDYGSYARSDLAAVLRADAAPERFRTLRADVTASGYVQVGAGGFGPFHTLPAPAQVSSIRTFARLDSSGVVAFGNTAAVNIQRGTYDALYGLLFTSRGGGGFTVADRPASTGLLVSGQARRTRSLTVGGVPHLVVAVNDGPPVLIRSRERAQATVTRAPAPTG